MYFIHIA